MYQKGGLVLLDPELQNLLAEPIWEMLVSFDQLNEARARANSKPDGPRQFAFNKTVYEHIPGTETFTIPGTPLNEDGTPVTTFTPLQIMSANFPSTKSYRRRITPVKSAEKMLWLGDSARYKIIRAVQLHDLVPPVTPTTNEYTPFFQFLSEGVEDHWTVQQQYSSCKWATRQDEALATSMLLHYGWAQRFTERMKGCVIYRMSQGSDGIHLTFAEPHSYQQRMDAACARAREVYEGFDVKKLRAPFDLLFKEACRVFFSFDKYYISISAAYRQTALNKIRAFCEHLNNALRAPEDLPFPVLEQPNPEIDGVIEVKYDNNNNPIEYVLKWEDFLFSDGASDYQKRRLEEIGNNKNKNKILSVLEPGKIYSREDLMNLMSKNALTRAKNQTPPLIVVDHREGHKAFYRLNLESN